MIAVTPVSVPDTLSKPDIHRAWIENLRTDEVNTFGFAALERVLLQTDLKPDAAVLDAGCGTGTNSVWLAKRGFKVTAADFSEFALSEAEGEGIDYRREDLTALSLEDASFDAVICIGVLMHIPDVEKALQELVRVLRPGGYLIIAEANANAPETYAFAPTGGSRAEISGWIVRHAAWRSGAKRRQVRCCPARPQLPGSRVSSEIGD